MRRLFLGACLTISLALGCGASPGMGPDPQARASVEPRREIIGQSVEGASIEIEIHGSGARTLLLMASIHGSEAAGTPLLRRVSAELKSAPELLDGQRVILLPVANPDGLGKNRRVNARGVDLNRNFPAGNFASRPRHGEQALSEPESRALHDLILREKPALIVTIHQPLTCLDWDGPGEELARRMAAACDLPVKRLGSRPGSLGSWAGETLGIPIVTVELPRAADALSEQEAWEKYGPMLMASLKQ